MPTSAESSKLERQGAHTLVTTALSVGLGLLLSVVAARNLGPAGKGLLDLTSTTAGLFTLILGFSLNVGITQQVAGLGYTPGGLAGQLTLWAAGAGLITAIALCWHPELAIRLGLLPDRDHFFWVSFVSVTVTGGVCAAGLRGILIGRHALIVSNRIDVVLKAALFAAYVGVAFALPAEPKWYALAGVGGAVVLPFLFLSALHGPTNRVPGIWPALLAAALPVHGTNLLHFINQRADLFFVQAFHGTAEVALYALAVSLAQFVLLLSSALALPLLPQVSAAGSATEAAALTARACRLFVALGLVSSVALALGGYWIVPLLFGRDFAGSLPALFILLPGLISFGITNIIIAYFVGRDRSQINFWISCAALAITLAGNLWLTRLYGSRGAAITSTAAYGLAGFLSIGLFLRHAGGSARQVLWPAAGDWRAAVALVARFRP